MKPRFLTSHYSWIQGCFWMAYCILLSFSSVYLLDQGFSNTQIGLLLGLSGLLTALLQPFVGARADHLKVLSLGQFAALLILAMLLCTGGLLLLPGQTVHVGRFLSRLSLLQLLTSLLYALGYTKEELERPLIGVVCSYNEIVPGHMNLDKIAEAVKAGIRAAGQILSMYPETRIVILTVYEEDELVFSAFQLGACDYMLKNASSDEIISAIKQAWAGQSPIRPEIAGKIRSEFQRVKTYESSFLYMLNLLSSLTVAELDTLYLISSGYTRKQICEARCVEMSTVKSQIHQILKKFGKKKITEVIQNETDRQLLESIIRKMQ